MTEERVDKLEKKIDKLVESYGYMQHEIKLISKNLESLSDVNSRLIRIEEQRTEMKKDLDIIFSKLRHIDETGVRICGPHLERTKRLEEDISVIKSRAWQVYFLFLLQAIQIIMWLVRQ